jgi:hypothetical protein
MGKLDLETRPFRRIISSRYVPVRCGVRWPDRATVDRADPDPIGGTAWNRSDTHSRRSASVATEDCTFRLVNSTALLIQSTPFQINENELINSNHTNSKMLTDNGSASSKLKSIRLHGASIKLLFNLKKGTRVNKE